VAVGLGLLQARLLARPLQELAGAADRLGFRDARPLGRRTAAGNLGQGGGGCGGSAQRINELLTAERDFAGAAPRISFGPPLTALVDAAGGDDRGVGLT